MCLRVRQSEGSGRVRDIKLGRITREALIDHWKRRDICPREVDATMDDEEWQLLLNDCQLATPTFSDERLMQVFAEEATVPTTPTPYP